VLQLWQRLHRQLSRPRCQRFSALCVKFLGLVCIRIVSLSRNLHETLRILVVLTKAHLFIEFSQTLSRCQLVCSAFNGGILSHFKRADCLLRHQFKFLDRKVLLHLHNGSRSGSYLSKLSISAMYLLNASQLDQLTCVQIGLLSCGL